MEKQMSSLNRLQDKITELKNGYEAIKQENVELKADLTTASGFQGEKDAQIEALQRELREKDEEIEKIIAQVETLLA